MRTLTLLFLSIFIFQNCSKPKATVFEDKRLAQEEVVKLCFIGDLGKDSPHQQIMADALGREECHRIFFLGDLVYPKGISSVDDPEFEKKFLDYYKPLLDQDPNLIIPLVLGNHDHKKDPSAWKDVSKRYEGFFFPNYYYMIDYGGLCLVALDTSFYYYTEKVLEATEQASWLFQLQSRLKDCEVKVAVTHHPLKGNGYDKTDDWEGATGPLKAFLETYIIGKFDIHVAGHVHVLVDDGRDEKTRMLISGAGGENRSGGRSGFVVLRWEPHNPKRIGYSLRYIDTEVNVFDESQPETEQERQEEVVSEQDEHIIYKDRVEPWWPSKWVQTLLDRFRK